MPHEFQSKSYRDFARDRETNSSAAVDRDQVGLHAAGTIHLVVVPLPRQVTIHTTITDGLQAASEPPRLSYPTHFHQRTSSERTALLSEPSTLTHVPIVISLTFTSPTPRTLPTILRATARFGFFFYVQGSSRTIHFTGLTCKEYIGKILVAVWSYDENSTFLDRRLVDENWMVLMVFVLLKRRESKRLLPSISLILPFSMHQSRPS